MYIVSTRTHSLSLFLSLSLSRSPLYLAQLTGLFPHKITPDDAAFYVHIPLQVRDFARVHRTYNPGLAWSGLNHVVQESEFSHAPHAAVLGGGVGLLFEYNLVSDVVWETSDAGAFYSGRRWDQRGNVLRHNTFRSIRTRVPVMQVGAAAMMCVFINAYNTFIILTRCTI